jgi:hypothetical protein
VAGRTEWLEEKLQTNLYDIYPGLILCKGIRSNRYKWPVDLKRVFGNEIYLDGFLKKKSIGLVCPGRRPGGSPVTFRYLKGLLVSLPVLDAQVSGGPQSQRQDRCDADGYEDRYHGF